MRAVVRILRELRFIPLLVGVASVLLSNRLYELNALANAGVIANTVFYPLLWSWWMLFAGALCVMYAWKIDNRWWGALSGAAVVTGFASRALGVAYQLWYKTTTVLADPQLHVIGIIYTVTAFLAFVVWFRLLRPATTLLREGRRRAD